ncbi:AraC family transcriptional regulator [Sphingobium cloacae]|uniref:HTH araC/xylS-type domain-containing protein n=1 Tax=Sphingobium cloacae TaxID=120107 RepID=A0A1E1EXS1_9SPHN|nr:AraC family transcriptional regulator [Sphingobium cloacae]BAV63054.1 hypothetical protein SCLO_1000140 [Sphingobium cloacae]
MFPTDDAKAGIISRLDATTLVGGSVYEITTPNLTLHWRVSPRRPIFKARLSNGPISKPGQMAIVAADIRAYIIAGQADETLHTLICNIDPDWLSQIADKPIRADMQISSLDFYNAAIEMYLRRAVEEITVCDLKSDFAISSLSDLIGIELCRVLGCHDSKRDAIMPKKRIQSVRNFIMESEIVPNVSDIAREFNVSIGYLSKSFKNLSGINLHRFIDEQRMERAKSMLISNTPIKRVAYLSGYSNHSAFGFAFKRYTGQTPQAFQIQHFRKT